jgi:hypothetical protein
MPAALLSVATQEPARPSLVPNWLEVVGIVGTVVGGVGAAVGAIAAWKAASRSAEASQVALDALALGVKPSLTARLTWLVGEESEGPIVEVTNESDWDAIDVHVEVFRKDGQRFKDSTQRLPARRNVQTEDEEIMYVSMGDIDPQDPGYEIGGLELFAERACVRFSDYRDIARYELCHYWEYERSEPSPEGFEGYGGSEWAKEDRIR